MREIEIKNSGLKGNYNCMEIYCHFIISLTAGEKLDIMDKNVLNLLLKRNEEPASL